MYLFLNKLNSAMYDRELKLFKNPSDIKRIIDGNFNKGEDPEKARNNLYDTILKNIGYDEITQDGRSKVEKVLQECNNIDIDGVKTSLIGGTFDFRKYMSNDNYKEAAIDYYNLFKNSVNIFDVLNESPLFNEMINGVYTTHNLAMAVSRKYSFVFGDALDCIRRESPNIIKLNDGYVGYRKNDSYAIPIDSNIIRKLSRQYDDYVISSFLKDESGNMDKYKFNIKDILINSGKDRATLYSDDSAKQFPIGNNNSTITINKGSDFNIDLTSDRGIANFKLMMENLVLPIIQKDSRIGDILKLKSVRNSLGLFGNQIVSEYNLNDLKSESGYARYQEAISAFNDIDSISTKIKYANGSDASYKDLLWMYNLVTNDESFGPNRLSSLFVDYLKDSDSLPYKYYKYSAQIDNKKINIFNFASDEEQSKFDKQIAFTAFNKNGLLKISDTGNARNISIKNPDFVINTSFTKYDMDSIAKYQDYRDILSNIKDNGILTYLECE
jgi:hypothetical protein